MHCIKLNQIDFGREVKEIGTAAFEWCSELTVLKFPQQIKKICEYAFRNCISLKKVVLNDGLKTISCALNISGLITSTQQKVSSLTRFQRRRL